MKILVLSNFGMGLYKFRKELLQRLIKQGEEVYISLPYDKYIPKLEEIGCQFIETNIDRRGTNPVNDLKLICKYRRIIKDIKPDLVLTYTIKPNIYGGIICRISKIPYITNITGLGTSIENKGIVQKFTLFLYRIGLRKANCVFFQNQSNKLSFIRWKIVKNNYKVIPGSGVNLEQYSFENYPIDDGIIRFLFIGRIMENKGINELIEAAKHIKKYREKIEFHIIGFCEDEYSEKLGELNKLNIIQYHGQLDDVREHIKSCHAVILPSYHEGISNVLLEAASIGRPILATNVPGCKETFDDGISGIGFEPMSVHGVIGAVEEFIKLPYEMKKTMGFNARKKMEQEFDRNKVINAYLQEINIIRSHENEFV
ncbi:MAG: glycosyltransferase family 4 protein [bacterium]